MKHVDRLFQLVLEKRVENLVAPAIRCEATDDAADIYIYDVIDPYWGASAAGLVEAFVSAGGKPVTLHINSPGGDAFEGQAMASAIADYKGMVTARVDGLCASAATTIAIAAAKVTMVEGALWMIHNAWSFAMGDASDLRATADLLAKVDGIIAKNYAGRTKCTLSQAVAWMDAETWFTAEEAQAAGFIDALAPNKQSADAGEDAGEDDDPLMAMARWNLNAFKHAPKVAEPEPRVDFQQLLQANRNRLRLLVQVAPPARR